MPLDSANQWTYRMTQTTFADGDSTLIQSQLTFEIAGTERVGQTDFAVLEVRSDGAAFPSDFGGFLHNSNEGLVKLPPNTAEKFVFRYPFESGRSYTMPDITSRYPFEVSLSICEVTVPAGTFACHVYTITTPDRPTRRDFYAPGLGLVRREIEGQIMLELLAYDLQPSDAPNG